MSLNNNVRILYIMLLLFIAIIQGLSYMANNAIQSISKLLIYVIGIYGINIINTFIAKKFTIITALLLEIIAFIINSFCFVISLIATQQLKVTTLPFDIAITSLFGLISLADIYQLWNLRSLNSLPIKTTNKNVLPTLYIWMLPFGWVIIAFTILQSLISVSHGIWDIAAIALSTWLPETKQILLVGTFIHIILDIIHFFYQYKQTCESCFEALPMLIGTQILLQSIIMFLSIEATTTTNNTTIKHTTISAQIPNHIQQLTELINTKIKTSPPTSPTISPTTSPTKVYKRNTRKIKKSIVF